MRTDVVFFFGILLFIFVAWVATGGPEKPISFSGPYLRPVAGPGETAEPYSLNRAADEYRRGEGGSGLGALQEQLSNLGSLGEASPYRGLVSMVRSTSGVRATDPKKEYLTLQVSARAQKAITITGWQLVSARGVSMRIPSGTEVARSGSVNQTAPIALAPGSKAIVTSGRSPVGVSFRENLCTGYLGEFQTFLPALPKACPSASEELARADLDERSCSDYARRIPRCSVVSDPPSDLSRSCEDFLEDTLTYNACVAEHRDDAGFAGATWRVFLGSGKELWRADHETIRLLDETGKTVDVLAY